MEDLERENINLKSDLITVKDYNSYIIEERGTLLDRIEEFKKDYEILDTYSKGLAQDKKILKEEVDKYIAEVGVLTKEIEELIKDRDRPNRFDILDL